MGWHCPENYVCNVHLSWACGGCPGGPSHPAWSRVLQPRTCGNQHSGELGECVAGTDGLDPQYLSVVSEQGKAVTFNLFHLSLVWLVKFVSKAFFPSGLESFAKTEWAHSVSPVNTVHSRVPWSLYLDSLPPGVGEGKEINSIQQTLSEDLLSTNSGWYQRHEGEWGKIHALPNKVVCRTMMDLISDRHREPWEHMERAIHSFQGLRGLCTENWSLS